MVKKRIKNPRAFGISLVAFVFLIFAFTIHWSFFILAAILSGIGWKELLK